MADSSKALPVSITATDDQLVCAKYWHQCQVTHLDHNKGPNRDEKSIVRSEGTIHAINKVLKARVNMEQSFG